jgi:hypothetical protein
MTELGLRTVDVSGVVKHSRRVAMDGDENVCEDKREVEGGPLRQPLTSGLWERARLFFVERLRMLLWRSWSW